MMMAVIVINTYDRLDSLHVSQMVCHYFVSQRCHYKLIFGLPSLSHSLQHSSKKCTSAINHDKEVVKSLEDTVFAYVTALYP